MRFHLRNFVLWVVTVLLLLALFTLLQNPGPRRVSGQVAFSELLDAVDRGNVRSVVIRVPEIEATLVDGHGFTTYAPPNDPDLVQRLHAKRVAITAAPPYDNVPWFVSLVVSWAPFIVLIGAWVFLSRRMRDVGIRRFGFGEGIAIAALRDDPERWRDCAREARAAAGRIGDPQSERQMLEIARGYEYLAQRAEEKARGSDNPT